MRETGIVTKLTGDMVMVKVNRKVSTGCGCGNSVTTEETMIKAKNLCNAKLNDQVVIATTHDEKRYQSNIKAFGAVFAFGVGAVAGENIFPHMGVELSAPYSLIIGFSLGVFTYRKISNIFKKKPLPDPVAYSLAKDTSSDTSSCNI